MLCSNLCGSRSAEKVMPFDALSHPNSWRCVFLGDFFFLLEKREKRDELYKRRTNRGKKDRLIQH